MSQKNEIVYTRPCPICQKPIAVLKDFDYIDDDGICRAVKSEEGTVMCDYAQDDGCFETYHNDCFDVHECPAHKFKANI